MSCANTTGDERIFIEILGMADLGLTADTLRRNWDVDEQRAKNILETLEAKGYAEHVGDGVYAPTPEADQFIHDRATV